MIDPSVYGRKPGTDIIFLGQSAEKHAQLSFSRLFSVKLSAVKLFALSGLLPTVQQRLNACV